MGVGAPCLVAVGLECEFDGVSALTWVGRRRRELGMTRIYRAWSYSFGAVGGLQGGTPGNRGSYL